MRTKQGSHQSGTPKRHVSTATSKHQQNLTRFQNNQKHQYDILDYDGNELDFVDHQMQYPEKGAAAIQNPPRLSSYPPKQHIMEESRNFVVSSDAGIKFFLIICVSVVSVGWILAGLVEYVTTGSSLLLNSSTGTELLAMFIMVIHHFLLNKKG